MVQLMGLVIGGTLFQHRMSHKVTWRSPHGMVENQIDHVTINRKWRSSLQDVRVNRGADVGSDNHLVVADIKINVLAEKKVMPTRSRYDTNTLRTRHQGSNHYEAPQNEDTED